MLSAEAIAAVNEVIAGYSTLEYDREKMARGSRHDRCERLICALTGAEAAIAVNNNAAAAMTVPMAFAAGADLVSFSGDNMAKVDEYGVGHDTILFDPLVTTLGTNQQSFLNFIEAVELIKAGYPDVHFTSGLSNISYGLPYRKAINMQFLALAMAKGMDSAIMDPMSKDMLAAMYATDALLGNDPYRKNHTRGYRNELFGNKPKA